jgi:hypothetical protein
MQRGRKILFACAGLVVAGTIAALTLTRHPREPEYAGRSLSQWLAAYNQTVNFGGPEKPEPSADAIRHIGTNALPWLLDWIQYEEPAWRGDLYYGRQRQSFFLGGIGHIIKPAPTNRVGSWLQSCYPCRPTRHDTMAMRGFEILGPQAAPAVPELTRLIHQRSRSWDLRYNFMRALAQIQGAGTDALRVACNDADPALRSYAERALQLGRTRTF